MLIPLPAYRGSYPLLSAMTTAATTSGDSSLCSRRTNWYIAAGDLETSVTFDSSSDFQETTDSAPNSIPLILMLPGMESGPCEIQLSFSQKYEIRQIYVRSTARVYEIYYSQSQQSDNEYLCTVRCSVAERGGEVLRAVYTGALAEGCIIKPSEELNQEKSPSEGNSIASEDDWVEVRAVDAPQLENKRNFSSMQGITHGGTEIQDFYEATAEISESDSCTSLTIRLLSLQNKGSICIDEVYIFADPVVSIEPENQSRLVNSSNGSSLMAMLVPTLLQLSRSSTNQVQNQQASHDLMKVNQQEAQPNAAGLTDASKGKANLVDNSSLSTGLSNDTGELVCRNQIESQSVSTHSIDVATAEDNPDKISAKLTDLGQDAVTQQDRGGISDRDRVYVPQDANGSAVEPAENQPPHQILDGKTSSACPLLRNNSPDNNVEKILEQLLSRVTRIEEVCLRFEERMLKPLSNMETKIHRIEEQLDLLAKNSEVFGVSGCKKFSAPPFSCDSSSGLFQDEARNYQTPAFHEFVKKDFDSGDNGMSDSVNSTHLLPSLVVTAPEFSGEDDQDADELKLGEQYVDELKLALDYPVQNPKRILIDDVLAASLAGLLSSSAASYPSEDPKPAAVVSETSEIFNKNISKDVFDLPMEAVGDTADAVVNEERATCLQSLTFIAPEFSPGEDSGGEYSDDEQLQAASLPGFATKKLDSSLGEPFSSTENQCSDLTSQKFHSDSSNLECSQTLISTTAALGVCTDTMNFVPFDTGIGETDVENDLKIGLTIDFWGINTNVTFGEAENSSEASLLNTRKEPVQKENLSVSTSEKGNTLAQLLELKEVASTSASETSAGTNSSTSPDVTGGIVNVQNQLNQGHTIDFLSVKDDNITSEVEDSSKANFWDVTDAAGPTENVKVWSPQILQSLAQCYELKKDYATSSVSVEAAAYPETGCSVDGSKEIEPIKPLTWDDFFLGWGPSEDPGRSKKGSSSGSDACASTYQDVLLSLI